MNKLWDVVVFDGNSVGSVPSCWDAGERGGQQYYMWPINVSSKKLQSLIKNCEKPDILIAYKEIKAVKKKQTKHYEKLEKIIQKVIEHETETDAQSAISKFLYQYVQNR